jgi:hypothetical protein
MCPVIADDGGEVLAALVRQADGVIGPARQGDDAHRLLAGFRQGHEVVQAGLHVQLGARVVLGGPALDHPAALPVRRHHQEALPCQLRDVAALVLVVATLGVDEQHGRERPLAWRHRDLDGHVRITGFQGEGPNLHVGGEGRPRQQGQQQGEFLHGMSLKKMKGRPGFSCPPRGAGWTKPGPGAAHIDHGGQG